MILLKKILKYISHFKKSIYWSKISIFYHSRQSSIIKTKSSSFLNLFSSTQILKLDSLKINALIACEFFNEFNSVENKICSKKKMKTLFMVYIKTFSTQQKIICFAPEVKRMEWFQEGACKHSWFNTRTFNWSKQEQFRNNLKPS